MDEEVATIAEEFTDDEVVTIAGDFAHAKLPLGIEACMPVTSLCQRLTQQRDRLKSVVWPDGVRHVWATPTFFVALVEIPCSVRLVRWIADDSPAPYGPRTKYRDPLRLAMPYIEIYATFALHEKCGGFRLTQRCECFAMREAIKSIDSPLLILPLPNISKHTPIKESSDKPVTPRNPTDPDSQGLGVPTKSVAWFCTQNLPISPYDGLETNERIRASIGALTDYLFSSGFNGSSDSGHHPGEEMSYWKYSVLHGIDKRIHSPERWAKATERDPSWILDVNFLPAGFTAGQLARRIFKEFDAKRPPIRNAADLARVVFAQSESDNRIIYPNKLWPTPN